ncbi:hypothetical protein [Bradyrhizobium sp. SSUT77]|nr:hypothetical protein [Bradyrhizobium sp. SSUT77]MDH2348918.1 hypothetical protein [Bradyrhizobium sp. SSUT77]
MFMVDATIAQLSAPPSLPLNNELRLAMFAYKYEGQPKRSLKSAP